MLHFITCHTVSSSAVVIFTTCYKTNVKDMNDDEQLSPLLHNEEEFSMTFLQRKVWTTYFDKLVLQRLWYVLSCLWDGAYKRSVLICYLNIP